MVSWEVKGLGSIEFVRASGREFKPSFFFLKKKRLFNINCV